jgi:hypothetical protein
MACIAAGDGAQVEPAVENLGRRRAAGIYGAILTPAAALALTGTQPGRLYLGSWATAPFGSVREQG